MAVHNGEKYIRQALESILNQSYSDFQFIIIDDGSSDETSVIVKSYRDTRIMLIHNKINLGLSRSLNIGLSYTNSQFIARMDADDISYPDRFEKQMTFMINNPQLGALGSSYKVIDEKGLVIEHHKQPYNDLSIRWQLLFNNAFCHSSLMIRKRFLDQIGGNYDNLTSAQDFSLVSRLVKVSKLANLPDFLVMWRKSEQQISSSRKTEQELMASEISMKNINELMGCSFISRSEANNIRKFFYSRVSVSAKDIPLIEKWIVIFHKFIEKNHSRQDKLEMKIIISKFINQIISLLNLNITKRQVRKIVWACLKIDPYQTIKVIFRHYVKN